MSNMGYCKFRNTLGDLEDCYDSIDDNDLSDAEHVARAELLNLCARILESQEVDVDGDQLETALEVLEGSRCES